MSRMAREEGMKKDGNCYGINLMILAGWLIGFAFDGTSFIYLILTAALPCDNEICLRGK